MAPAVFRSVEQLLRPRSIAIIGASETGGGGWAKQLFDNLAFAGFPAEVYLINPRRSELWGQKALSGLWRYWYAHRFGRGG